METYLGSCLPELKEYLLDESVLRVLDQNDNTVELLVFDARDDGSALQSTDFEEQRKAARMAQNEARAAERKQANEKKRSRTVPLIYQLLPVHLGAKLNKGHLNAERNAITAAIFQATQANGLQIEIEVEYVQLKVKGHLMNKITAYVELPPAMNPATKKLIDWQRVKRVTFSPKHPPLQCHIAAGICDSWKLAPCCFRSTGICKHRNARDCDLYKAPSYNPQDRKRAREDAKEQEKEADLQQRRNKAREGWCTLWTEGRVRNAHECHTHTLTNLHCMTVSLPPQLPARHSQRQKVLEKKLALRLGAGLRVARPHLHLHRRRVPLL